MNYNFDSRFKDIADGLTAFCIFGGPSVKEVVNLEKIIDNNFTVAVNYGIKFYKPDLYISGDNQIVREFFEDKEFILHKFKGGKLLKDKALFEYDEEPIIIEGKSHLVKDSNMVKILISNDFPCYNYNFTSGQIYKQYAYEYCKKIPNTWVVTEHRSSDAENWPTLSPEWEGSIDNYGKDMNCIYPGGMTGSPTFQILYYMGFKKVITVGLGDIGKSRGNPGRDSGVQSTVWGPEEVHSIPIHNHMWSGDRDLKILHGGEIFNQYGKFNKAKYDELLDSKNKTEKDNLIKKIKNIGELN